MIDVGLAHEKGTEHDNSEDSGDESKADIGNVLVPAF